MNKNEFDIFISSEKLARIIYKNYKGHNKNIDFLFETNIISFYYSDLKMPIYYKTYELLKNEYDIDMLELEFFDTKEKEKVINYINYINADDDIDKDIKL